MDKNWWETTKMYMNRTERVPIFLSKKALILTQEGKDYLYSDVVRIHEKVKRTLGNSSAKSVRESENDKQ